MRSGTLRKRKRVKPGRNKKCENYYLCRNNRCKQTLSKVLMKYAKTVTVRISGREAQDPNTSFYVQNKTLNGQVAVPATSVDLTLSSRPFRCADANQ